MNHIRTIDGTHSTRPVPRGYSTAMVIACLMALANAHRAGAAGYICAEGGGGLAKGVWADGVFQWMIEHGGERRVVVIGYHEEPDASVERVFMRNGAASVKHLVVPDRETADEQATHDALMDADIVWIRGGDQSKYVKNWRRTQTELAIRAVYNRGGVIGGTSAGAAVLGEVIYDAFRGSLRSEAALRNAYDGVLTLSIDFLSLTPGVLFDTHFTERGRLPRLAVMLARRYEDAQQDLVGVGLDYRTALCVHPDLTAEVRGEGTVTFIHRTHRSQQFIQRHRPPAVTDLAYAQLTNGYVYDLKSRRIVRRPGSPTVAIADGTNGNSSDVSGRRFTPCRIDGSAADHEQLGAWSINDRDDKSALFNGSLTLEAGLSRLPGTVVVNRLWDEGRHIENGFGGAQWALFENGDALAVLLASEHRVEASHGGVLHVRAVTPDAPSAVIIDSMNGPGARHEIDGASRAAASSRKAAVIEQARLHILKPDAYYNAALRVPLLARPRLDLNADGRVDGGDFAELAGLISGAAAASWQLEAADMNRDRRIDAADIDAYVEAVLASEPLPYVNLLD